MKSIFIVILAIYIVFVVVDLICCPVLYQKLFYRACLDALENEKDASLISKRFAFDFTVKNAFIPISHTILFIAAFMPKEMLGMIEKKIYDELDKETIIKEFNEVKKD